MESYFWWGIGTTVAIVVLTFVLFITSIIWRYSVRRMALSVSIDVLEEFVGTNDKFEDINVEVVRDMLNEQTKEYVPFSRKEERIRSVAREELNKIAKSKSVCTSVDCAKALKNLWVKRRWTGPHHVYVTKLN